MSEVRMRLDNLQFSTAYLLCKKNPMLGTTLGYICSAHMTPHQFQTLNRIEIVEYHALEVYA